MGPHGRRGVAFAALRPSACTRFYHIVPFRIMYACGVACIMHRVLEPHVVARALVTYTCDGKIRASIATATVCLGVRYKARNVPDATPPQWQHRHCGPSQSESILSGMRALWPRIMCADAGAALCGPVMCLMCLLECARVSRLRGSMEVL